MKIFNKNPKGVLLLAGMMAITTPIFATVYEDAEDNAITDWVIYGDTTDATIENVADIERGSRVIKLIGNGENTGFRLGNRAGRASYLGAWHNQTETLLTWSMKYDEPFRIYIPITTEQGNRYLTYTNQSVDAQGKIRGGKVNHGLGEDSINGEWHTYTRDLASDWNTFEPDNPFVSVNGFFIKGSGYIDDVMVTSGDQNKTIKPLTANAGADQELNITTSVTTVTLDGTASTAGTDAPIVSYEWFYEGDSLGTGAVLDVDNVPPGDYIVTLTVTDSLGNTSSDTVNIKVTYINQG